MRYLGRTIRISLKLLIFFFLFAFCVIEMVLLASATTYYVSTNGNDSYNGLNPSYQGGSNGPFLTLNRAAIAVQAGDTVYIREGTYQEASTWDANGTESNPITITNYNNETVTIDGNGHTIPGGETGNLLNITGDWYKVSNLNITKSSGYGINCYAAQHCIIDNIYAYQNWSWGIIGGSYCIISNCRAYNNSLMHEWWAMPQGGWGGGITVCRNGNKYAIIRGCKAWDNWGEGISTFETYHITIEDCISFNNLHNFYLSDTQYSLLQRSLSYYTPGNMIQEYTNRQNGIKLEDEKWYNSSNNTVINNLSMGGIRNFVAHGSVLISCLIAYNTFVNANPLAGSESACVYFHSGTSTGSSFKNNIILQENGTDISHLEARGISFSYNCWSKTPLSGCRGTGDVIADPKLAKTGSRGPGLLTPEYFKILENSPAKDRAQILSAVIEDFFKNPRGSSPDMGAIELTDGPSPLAASASGSPTSGQAPLTVNFKGSATGGTTPYSYRWTFGDGNSSTAQNPSHTYSSSGTYTATFAVTDNVSSTATASVNINVSAISPLSASATASPTSGQAPLTVNFTGSATGGISPYSYRWNFGDGGSSTAKNPSHTYSSSGTYSATLTVTDSASTQASDSMTITVSSSTVNQTLLLSAATGEPSPGSGGFTNPNSGTHSYSQGSSVSVRANPNSGYRFSIWNGDVLAADAYDNSITVLMDRNKSLSAFFCTKCGDANGDLNITSADAQDAFNIYLKRIPNPPQCQIENADVDCNGIITPGDAQAISNKYLGIAELPGNCSGKTRTMAAGIISKQDEELSATLLLIEDVRPNREGYISVPIIIDSPEVMDAFGLDLAFPSNILTYLTLENAELTRDFEQLDSSLLASPPADRLNQQILRIGGYKCGSDQSQGPTYGILVKLVFRTAEEFCDPFPLFIKAKYDDIQNASVIKGRVMPRINPQIGKSKKADITIKKKPPVLRYYF